MLEGSNVKEVKKTAEFKQINSTFEITIYLTRNLYFFKPVNK